MTEQLLNEYKLRLQGLILAPYDDGRFEVFVNGKKIYSKHATGKFPEYKQVHAALEEAVA